ncbi:site-specific DNA-methyltransferase [Geobacter sulfurreducens]|uniref:site-specific DNA-methyltransferase n=1 Tax=Geobacter sulfurreducens TaxID=35554 RepID=UPI0020B8391B|nr:site-specific DNA-methyltransferase [Geobacter sulfurreducens]UTG93173.1 site-specific DNA-methyltransferase [Geobacter sulfurreducens]
MPELYFKGKEFVYNHHLTVPFRPLEQVPEKSIGTDSGNLIIHGDNLHALKALLPHYAGKVDCIFIDPPYNTGNENWCYNDNVNSPIMKEWLSNNPVNKEDMLRHDKWACLMYPRLKLLHELLSDRGSFWMTIDDNEVHRSRMMLDDIFGEENFAANVVWQKRYATANDNTGIAPMHDHVLVYQKSDGWQRNLLERTAENDQQYRYEDDRGVFRPDNYTCNKSADERPNLYYPVINPHTKEEVWPNRTAVWRYSKERHEQNIQDDLVFWGKDGKAKVPSFKRYRHLLRSGGGTVPTTWWPHEVVGHTDEAKKEINAIFADADTKIDFVTPKPTRLIERILQVAADSDALILDSFAGSGTTAHAVLSLNAKDGGNRNFILVECEDYADNLTAERVRRVINGYEYEGTQKEELLRQKVSYSTLKDVPKLLREIEHLEQVKGKQFDKITKTIKDDTLLVMGEKKITERTEGLGGGFTYCELGPPLDLDKLLTGEQLPDYKSLGAWLFHTATGEPLDQHGVREADWYLGDSPSYHVWLIYKPDLDWLKSRDAALTLTLAEKIAATGKDKRHLVFAPARFVASKHLLPLGVEHAPLPFALYRFEKD